MVAVNDVFAGQPAAICRAAASAWMPVPSVERVTTTLPLSKRTDPLVAEPLKVPPAAVIAAASLSRSAFALSGRSWVTPNRCSLTTVGLSENPVSPSTP